MSHISPFQISQQSASVSMAEWSNALDLNIHHIQVSNSFGSVGSNPTADDNLLHFSTPHPFHEGDIFVSIETNH